TKTVTTGQSRRRALGLKAREHVSDSDFDVPDIRPWEISSVDPHARTDVRTQPSDEIPSAFEFHGHTALPASLEIHLPYRVEDGPPALTPERIDLDGRTE